MKKHMVTLLTVICNMSLSLGQTFMESADSFPQHYEVYSQAPFCTSFSDNIEKINYWEIRKISEKNKLKVGNEKITLLDWYLKSIDEFIDIYGEPDKISALSYIYKLHEYWCFPQVFSNLSETEIPIKIYYWEEKQLTVFCIPDNEHFRYPESLSALNVNQMVKYFEHWMSCNSGNEQWRILLWKKGIFDLKQYASFGVLPYSNPFYEYSDGSCQQYDDNTQKQSLKDYPKIFSTFTRNSFFEFYSTLPIVWLSGRQDKYCLNELYGMNYKDLISKFGNPAYNETYLFLNGMFALPRVTWPVEELLSNYEHKIIPMRISRYYNLDGYLDFWFIRNSEDFTYDGKLDCFTDIIRNVYTNTQTTEKSYLQWLAHCSDSEGWSLIYVDLSFYDNPYGTNLCVEM